MILSAAIAFDSRMNRTRSCSTNGKYPKDSGSIAHCDVVYRWHGGHFSSCCEAKSRTIRKRSSVPLGIAVGVLLSEYCFRRIVFRAGDKNGVRIAAGAVGT